MLSLLRARANVVGLDAVRRFSAAAAKASSTVAPSTASEWLREIETRAEKHQFLKRNLLQKMLWTVQTKDELSSVLSAMKIYEKKKVDPTPNCAGIFVAIAVKLDALDLVQQAFESNSRLGLFVEPGMAIKLMTHFLNQGDAGSALSLLETIQKNYNLKPNCHLYDVIIRAQIENKNVEQAIQTLEQAIGEKKANPTTFSNVLTTLLKQKQTAHMLQVAQMMKDANIELDATTEALVKQAEAAAEAAQEQAKEEAAPQEDPEQQQQQQPEDKPSSS